MSKNLIKYHKYSPLILPACCAFYISFAYYIDRSDFIQLFSLYCALFFLSWKLFQLEKFNFYLLLSAAILFRIIFLFSLPNLSQDFYRFIWDGRLLLEGINPYLFSPEELISTGNANIFQAKELIAGMGSLSAGNFSNYPPLNQLIFGIAAFFSGKSILGAVVIMRIFIIAADIGVIYLGRKLLKSLNLSENRIFWYVLNPFIIIELTGNLHFEGMLILFLIGSIYLLKKGKWLWSAIILACAISTKLIPLLFLPLFFRKLGLRKAVLYYSIIGLICFLFFLPFLSLEFLSDYVETTALWFQKFEFNASFYYLIRWVGYETLGYNIIETAGKVLVLLVFLFVCLLSSFRRNNSISGLLTSMLFAISFYYLLATTVHPWYLAVPVILCVFTNYKFPLVWSFLVVLSYQAYSNEGFQEYMWLIGMEYILILGFLIWEVNHRHGFKEMKTEANRNNVQL